MWALIHEDDLQDYYNDVSDSEYKRVCLIQNDAVCGIPCGSYIPYKLQGEERPFMDFDEIIDTSSDIPVMAEQYK